jgi:hypothetical protein
VKFSTVRRFHCNNAESSTIINAANQKGDLSNFSHLLAIPFFSLAPSAKCQRAAFFDQNEIAGGVSAVVLQNAASQFPKVQHVARETLKTKMRLLRARRL